MASNGTDWEYGESRSPSDMILPATIKSDATATFQTGDLVYPSSGIGGGKALVVKGTGTTSADKPCGIVHSVPHGKTSAAKGDAITILVRGITRVRMVNDANAIPLFGGVSHHDGKLTPAQATAANGSEPFGINVGGALAAAGGDNGLIYVDCFGPYPQGVA